MHRRFSFSQLPDPILLRALASAVARDRSTTAEILALIAEVDLRKLYAPAGYPSMLAYCVGHLRLSEDAAGKRIHAARVACRFPEVLEAVADGRLHLSAVVLLAPHLTEGTAGELLTAATHKTKAEVERMLVERFPRTETLTWVAAMPASPAIGTDDEHAPGRVEDQGAPDAVTAPERVGGEPQHAPGRAGHSRVKPLSSQSFEVLLTMSRRAHDKLRYLQELLSHQVPSGAIAEVVERAFDLAIDQLERRKFAATSKPPTSLPRATASGRHIPAHVRRAVWERDGGRCTFVSESGQRCPATRHLEFDHVLEVARGGEATVDGIRLLCRAHNQYAAERTFGADFMRHKREKARHRAMENRAKATRDTDSARTPDDAPERTGLRKRGDNPDQDVAPWLRALGVRGDDLRRGEAVAATIPDAPLAQRVRLAVATLARAGRRQGALAIASPA